MACPNGSATIRDTLIALNRYHILPALLLLAALFTIAGCSVESKNPIARGYHNLAARDNGFFLARELIKETEATIAKEAENDYTTVLPVLYPISKATQNTLSPIMEDVIKKASFPIVRHKGSRYDDDSYVLIGKARYYKGEYEDAVKTFKYANSIGKDDFAKNQALIWLMRTYMALNEPDNATAVSDYLKRNEKTMDKLNAKELYMTRAQFAMRLWEVKKIIANLELALPHIKKRDERSRVNFILAQLYQEQNNDTKAFEHYTAVVKGNPPYELGFHARLNMGQVTNLANTGDTKKIYKYYEKLLKDEKNKEYHDKIYYEMARFELKQGNNPKGLELLNKSLRVKSENGRQRAATHLLTAQTYYDKLQNYRKAAAYYDSTVMFMAATSPDYAYTKDRRDILKEFVTQLTIIENEDSLQRLASMSEADLSAYLDKVIADDQARQEKEKAEQQKKLEEQKNQPDAFLTNDTKGTPTSGQGGANWYFYNQASVGSGRNEFMRIWGSRVLEDNWRRANKVATMPAAQAIDPNAAGTEKDSLVAELTEEQIAEAKAKEAAAAKTALMSRIPRGPQQLAASTERLQNAYFALGNIYNLQLEEPARAAETFEKLLTRFPAHPKKVEVYYSLFLIYSKLKKDPEAAKYRALIISEFPTSTYAKILDNPNYLKENMVRNEKARDLYDSAYVMYEKGNYPRARNLVASVQNQYPQNDIPDHLSLLQVLITGRTDTLALYKQGLEGFIVDYKSSHLVPYAQQLLNKYNEFANKAPDQLAKVNKVEKAEYLTNISGPHVFVLVYSARDRAFKNITSKFSDFNDANYSVAKLTSSDIVLNDSTIMTTIREFGDNKAALRYLDRMKGKFSPLEEIAEGRYKIFVISTDNFPIMYKSKNIDEYMVFFRKRYF